MKSGLIPSFNQQHRLLVNFYYECSNLRYLTSLISVPRLPQVAVPLAKLIIRTHQTSLKMMPNHLPSLNVLENKLQVHPRRPLLQGRQIRSRYQISGPRNRRKNRRNLRIPNVSSNNSVRQKCKGNRCWPSSSKGTSKTSSECKRSSKDWLRSS